MKYIIAILIFFPLFGKSQDTIKIPVPAARQIVKDLTVCDSLKEIHQLLTKQLTIVENKVELKDSIIDSYKQKCFMYNTMISNERRKFEMQKMWIGDLKKENKNLKVKLLYTKITMGAIITFLGYLLITK
jgi:hypothetical protein